MAPRQKKALITGITGQDGSYLAELLLAKGYQVHGIVRRASTFNTQRIDAAKKSTVGKNMFLHYGDLSDSSSLDKIVSDVKPDEIYNLGAQSHVRVSFDIPEYTTDVTGLGVLRMLEAMKKYAPQAKFYQASSSEMFGEIMENPQTEKTPFNPQSPYGIAKVLAHQTACKYRDAYGLFVSCGILFNHESPRRGENFVTRKIALGVAGIKSGTQDCIHLGNLDAKRDWGYAPEYCEAMWLMLQKDKPGDYVIATSETHSVREFLEEAFKCIDIKISWKGSGINERGINTKNRKTIVDIDPVYFRANEVDYLRGSAAKAKKELKWEPKTTFKKLVEIMVDHELNNSQPR